MLALPQRVLTQGKPPSQQQGTHRILVKLQPSLAQQFEAELPAQGGVQAMTIQPGLGHGAGVQSFLARYSPSSLAPLYPGMIRARQQHGWSDAQLADHLRQQFPGRAARQPQPAATPEISRTYILDFPGTTAKQVDALVQRLQADPNVEFAEPDKIVTTNQLPNDHFLSTTGSWGQSYPDLWGHYKVNAPAAWNTALGDGIIVAVVDTGIDYNHPDIAANIWQNAGEIANNGIDDDHNGFIDDKLGWDFIGSNCFNPTQSNDPIDHFGHGTHVAGTIAAVGNNTIGIIGIAWHAQVMAVKGLDDVGCGLESTLAPAIQYATNNGADVINASWGGQGSSQAIEDAIQFAYNLGVVFVAAAGNSSEDALNFFPANSPEAITAAASDPLDDLAFFSNFGSKIDVTAPGVDILSLRASGSNLGFIVNNDYMRLDGTSMAAPHVSGTIALILSQHPSYATEDVRQLLRASATSTDGWDPHFGYGIVNAQGALSLSSVLRAHISSPASGLPATSPVTISGTAQGSSFDHYVLEYGAGVAPKSFTTLATSTSPVSGGVLGTFDPAQVPDGLYTVRLTAFDSSNHQFSDRIEVLVSFLAITSPFPPPSPTQSLEFKPGAQVQLVGTATGGSFKDFRVEWAEGIEPATGWSSTGVTLVGGGAAPVSGGLVATWDTSAIGKADYYTIRLLVDDAGFTSEADTIVYLEPDLLSQNWPQVLNQVPNFGTGFVPFLDAAGNVKLGLVTPVFLFDSIPGQYFTFPPDGSSQTLVNVNTPSYFNPAAATLDQNPGQEMVVAEFSDIRIFRPDGSSTTIPLPADFSSYALTQTQVVLEALEGTSQLDIVDMAEGFDAQGNMLPTAPLFAWRPDGSLLNSNFPILIPNQNQFMLFPNGPRFLVGDLNGDGTKEFVAIEGVSSNTFTLGLFAQDGTPRSWSVPVMQGGPGPMVMADLDHNGKLETILVQNVGTSIGSSFTSGLLHVFQPDGTERPGWPVPITVVGLGGGSLAVGDVNGDGREEIVVDGQDTLYVLKTDGTSLSSAWPLTFTGCTASGCPPQTIGPVLLADIDGDGLPEILVPQWNFPVNPLFPGLLDSSIQSQRPELQQQARAEGWLRRVASLPRTSGAIINPPKNYNTVAITAFRNDGTVAKSWNLQGTTGMEPDVFSVVLSVGDFQQNGATDIAVSYQTETPGVFSFSGPVPGMVEVLATGAPFHPTANDWPQIYQNTRNTAALPRRAIKIAVLTPTPGTTVSGPITLSATATDTSATITGVQFQVDGTNIGSPVANPPYTITWDPTQVPIPGHHELAAVATDTAGNVVASASVLVNVVRANNSSLALTSGANPSPLGSSLTFTATVSPNIATGTVVFFDGTTAISGNVPLAGGSAHFTTSSLSLGSHSITAQYSGDINFNGSTSPVLTQNVALLPDFSVAAFPPSATIIAGQSATFSFTVTPLGGFNQAVNFSCSGLPAAAQCIFAPPSVTPNGAPVTSTLTITTTAPSAALGAPPVPQSGLPLYASLSAGMLGMIWLALASRKRGQIKARLALAMLTLCLLAALVSCGGQGTPPIQNQGTPRGTSQITVTTSSGSAIHTASVTLVVN